MEVAYNTYYDWISQDDIVSSNPQIIEWNNVDWLRTWYWITLWPKLNKKRLVWSKPLCLISNSYIGCENWEIYTKAWADTDAAYYTFSNWYDVVKWISYGWYWYFFTKPTVTTYVNLSIYRISLADFWSWTFADLWGPWKSVNSLYWAVTLETKSYLYIWSSDTVSQVTSACVVVDFWLFDWYVTHIAKQWTTYKVYTDYNDEGRVAFWDWINTSISSQQELWIEPVKWVTNTTLDYIIWENCMDFMLSNIW